ncbi:anti-phage protein KwaB [Epilithonimonas xixisoli]|uniref:Uncharacterized protein DUF4868 n=1 Tax=Epilithonimonas xixisoli TaxID=1476462 RepID=A0A4R8IAJ4_9FLAO|nr:anti-phage protein KwaB [Epilithonimonas xixisoli]TDX86570.1 uncharacterized protein DUF4868 [Epilithonimonas xixisoli]
MTRTQLINSLNTVLNQGNQLSTVVFAVMKESFEIKKLNIDNNEISTIQEMFLRSIREKIINVEEQTIIKVSEADNRANTVFHYDLDLPTGLDFYSSPLTDGIANFSFANDDLGKIDSLIIKIGTETNQIKIFKKLSPVEVLGRGGFLLRKARTQLERFTEKILNLTPSFNAVFVGDTYIFLDLKLLENSYGFHDVIVREANNSVQLIQALQILTTTEGIVELLGKTSFARKVVKIKNSPVILKQIPNAQIITFTQRHPSLANKMRYSDDGTQIILHTKKSRELFIKMLDDAYLTSELTEQYYESSAKDVVEGEEDASNNQEETQN